MPLNGKEDAAFAAGLRVAAESNSMIWNAVVVDRGRVIVGGPRWSGSKGPPLAKLDGNGIPVPYPDEAWNAWRDGDDVEAAFVNVNAVHRDREGRLWVIDSGTPVFGGEPLPGGTKAVCIDPTRDAVLRVFAFAAGVATRESYFDDIRINGEHGYLTDAGRPGVVVLDLKSGEARRVFDRHPAATASNSRNIVVDGTTVLLPDGSPLKVNSDPLEISPDGKWLYFAPLEGPWVRIETRYLDDPSIWPEALDAALEPWADLPPIVGSTMDDNGELYFTDLAECALKRLHVDGTIATIVRDPVLHWIDAPFIDEKRAIWLPVPQLDRAPMFNQGVSKIEWPVRLYTYQLEPSVPYADT
jgi:sugar lactone lactonase YvrE